MKKVETSDIRLTFLSRDEDEELGEVYLTYRDDEYGIEKVVSLTPLRNNGYVYLERVYVLDTDDTVEYKTLKETINAMNRV